MAGRFAEDAATEEVRGVVVQATFFRRLGRTVAVSRAPISEPAKAAPRPLHVARMLALAHEVVRHIEDGTYADQADAARALGFTRARITQLVDLTLLAPDIQERLLFTVVSRGRDQATERGFRQVVAAGTWWEQRRRCQTLLDGGFDRATSDASGLYPRRRS